RRPAACPEWPEEDRSGERSGEEERYEPGEAGCAEDRSDNEERDDRCRVVQLDRRLRRRSRQQVRGKPRQLGDEEARGRQKEPKDRQRELEQVVQVAPFGYRSEESERVGDGGLEDPARGAADRGRAAGECACV